MGNDTMRHRFAAVTADLLDTDSRVTVVLADMGVGDLEATGAGRRHRSRIVNVGIREQLMIAMAAGMALEGLRPIVHSYAPFLVERPFEFLKLDLSHQGVGAVLVSTGASFDAAAEGRTHQAPEDVLVVGSLPGWQVDIPGHPDELEVLLRHAAAGDAPVYIRMATKANREPRPIVPGRLHVSRLGREATVVAVGPMLDPVIEATAHLDVTVAYATRVRPLDRARLRELAGASPVVLVEPYLEGTSAHEVSVALSDRAHRLLSVGVPRGELRHYGHPREHARAHALDGDGIRRSIDVFLGRGPLGVGPRRPGTAS